MVIGFCFYSTATVRTSCQYGDWSLLEMSPIMVVLSECLNILSELFWMVCSFVGGKTHSYWVSGIEGMCCLAWPLMGLGETHSFFLLQTMVIPVTSGNLEVWEIQLILMLFLKRSRNLSRSISKPSTSLFFIIVFPCMIFLMSNYLGVFFKNYFYNYTVFTIVIMNYYFEILSWWFCAGRQWALRLLKMP